MIVPPGLMQFQVATDTDRSVSGRKEEVKIILFVAPKTV
jgi:hypothetical protein